MNSAPLSNEVSRIARFVSVGVLATVIHMSVSLVLSSTFGFAAQFANLAGFLTAFGFSFAGHHGWTFASDAKRRETLPKFFIVAFTGYLASAMMLQILQPMGWIGDEIRLVVSILVIPPASYLLNRFWVF